jgi:hypothetical protein
VRAQLRRDWVWWIYGAIAVGITLGYGVPEVRFALDGADAPAIVIAHEPVTGSAGRYSGGPYHYVDYRLTLSNGREYVGTQDVSAALYDELHDGDSTTAQYLRGDPEMSRIDRDFGRRQLFIYGSLLWLPFGVAVFLSRRRRLRARRDA